MKTEKRNIKICVGGERFDMSKAELIASESEQNPVQYQNLYITNKRKFVLEHEIDWENGNRLYTVVSTHDAEDFVLRYEGTEAFNRLFKVKEKDLI